jgi:hypothetical protein
MATPKGAASRQARSQRRNAAEGYCATARAHGPPAPGYRVCEECRVAATAMAADRREARIDAGLCGICGRRPLEHGRMACRPCLNRLAAAAQERRASGLCARSQGHGAAVEGRTECMGCLAAHAERSRERRRAAREA